MTDDLQRLLRLAAKELVLAAEEPDAIKKSHHQEFADRHFSAALALDRSAAGTVPVRSWLDLIPTWLRTKKGGRRHNGAEGHCQSKCTLR